VGEAGTHLSRARRDVKAFLKTGDEEHLGAFLATVLLSGVASISHSILFRCLEMDTGNLPIAAPDRLMRLYGCHPVMGKRYFGRLLQAKCELQMSFCADDILTGMFQKLGSITSSIESIRGTKNDPVLDHQKLASCREWAVMRLQHWLAKEGARKSQRVAETWRSRTFEKVSGPFHGGKRNPESPRDMAEWAALIDDAFEWLGEKWNNEIGISPWISENKLFQMMRQAFKPLEVLQHAQPVWLVPQHLDVFVPELSLAVEYMGRQHYEPIEYFGGEEGFRQAVDRDQRKGCLCKQLGIELIYVRHDEDIAKRVSQIRAMHGDAL